MVSAVVSGLLVALVAVAVLVFNQPLGELLPFLKMDASPQNRTVIVVGGGLAGMSAALEAAQNGASVILLDKEKGIGGNSAKASSGINAAGTPAQEAKHIPDSVDLLQQDTLKSGGGLSDPVLVNILAQSSKEAVLFLTSLGVNLEELSICGGHAVARTHRSKAPTKGNIGFIITSTLRQKIEGTPQIQVRTHSRLDGLVVTAGRVTGVRYTNTNTTEQVTLAADSVILATGGFGADRKDLLARFAPSTAPLPTTNGPFATGDGVKIATRDVDAEQSLMDQVQVHPTGLFDPKQPSAGTVFLGAEALRGSGGILVDKTGSRFVNELDYRSKVTDAILQHGHPFTEGGNTVAFLLLNDEAVNLFQASAFGFYVAKGLATKFNSVAELATQKNMPNLLETLKEYNEAKTAGQDKFGKTTFPVSFDANQSIYLMYVTPAIHYTMGGVKITPQTQVLSAKGTVVPGLYAAGEVTGGLHGQNRLAGNSLLECVVFGRRAGKAASGVVIA